MQTNAGLQYHIKFVANISVSWGHRRNINIGDVLSMDEMVKLIAKTVSCGGNILINVGPTKEGTIIPIFQVSVMCSERHTGNEGG